jgi:hypothetical protein
MNRFIVVLVLVAIGIVGVGFYQGWFHVGSEKADGKSTVTLSVDKDKFQEDKKTAVEDMQGVERRIKEKVAGPGEKSTDGKDKTSAGSGHDGKP